MVTLYETPRPDDDPDTYGLSWVGNGAVKVIVREVEMPIYEITCVNELEARNTVHWLKEFHSRKRELAKKRNEK